jgi:flagellar protein FliT
MDEVEKLLEITEELVEWTKRSKDQHRERDQVIQKIEDLLAKREELTKNMNPPFTVKEKEAGQKIVQLNQILVKQLEQIKQDIQHDIIKMKAQKETAKKYMNPYANATIDGIFYDKKK